MRSVGMEYLIGVDAGGTKTKFSMYDVNGVLVKDFNLDAANIVVQKEYAWSIIQQGLNFLLTKYHNEVKMILVGIAGIETSGLQNDIENKLKALYNCPFIVMSDAKLALINKLKGNDGGLIISGTGSVGYGLQHATFYRVGGWGHLLGDEGSAYSIGLACYKQLVNELDAGLELTDFSLEFLEYIGEKDSMKAISRFYEKSKKEIADEALFVAMYAKDGDVKSKILTDSIEALNLLLDSLIHKMKAKQENMEIAFAGSVLEKNEFIRESLIGRLAQKNIRVLPISQDFNTKAVYYYYRRNKGEKNESYKKH